MDDGPDFEEGNFFSMPSIGPTGHATANGGVTNVGSANLAQRQPKSSLLGAPPPPNPSLLSKPKSMVPPPSGTPGQPPSSTLSQSGEGISDMDGMSMMDNQSTSIPSSSMKSSMLPPPMMKPPMAMQPMQDTWLASDNPINHNKVWRAPHSQQHLHDPRMAMNQNMRHQMPPGFHPPPQNCPTGSMMRPPRPVWGEDWQRGRNFQQHQPPPQFAGGKYPPNSQFRRKMHNGKPYN